VRVRGAVNLAGRTCQDLRAYWGRPVPAHDPKLVGVVWQSDGSAKVFFGIIYPP
jgi:hypothetical protein